MRQVIISLLLRCYRWSLRLYPAAFRAEFGAEMEAVFPMAILVMSVLHWLLLRLNAQTGEADPALPTRGDLTGEQHFIWPRRLALALLAALLLVLPFFAGTWVFATGQLALAKAEGIYTTPQEGMEQRLLRGLADTSTKRFEIRGAGINQHDAGQPRVLYVIGTVWAGSPAGAPDLYCLASSRRPSVLDRKRYWRLWSQCQATQNADFVEA